MNKTLTTRTDGRNETAACMVGGSWRLDRTVQDARRRANAPETLNDHRARRVRGRLRRRGRWVRARNVSQQVTHATTTAQCAYRATARKKTQLYVPVDTSAFCFVGLLCGTQRDRPNRPNRWAGLLQQVWPLLVVGILPEIV